jgi:hypothetical protein
MRILPPSDQLEQLNIYQFENWVPDYLTEIVIDGQSVELRNQERLPSTSYRARYNERTDSWTCDWFDENGAVIDQGRRLSVNNWVRTTWGDGFLPTPMPAFLAVMETGDTGDEATFETFGRSVKLVELNLQDIVDAGLIASAPNVTVNVIS